MARDTLSRVISGWFRGCIAATAALDAFMLIGVALFGGRPAELMMFAVMMAMIGLPLTMVLTCLLSGLPAAVVIWFGEWLAIRSVVFYASAGASIGALIGALVLPREVPPIVIFATAGCLAGIVYWFSAGRSAGNRRGDDPTDRRLNWLACSGTSLRSCAVRRVLWGH